MSPRNYADLHEAARLSALLRDVNLLFFVDVTEKEYQPANKEDDGASNCPPHVMRGGLGTRRGDEEVKLVDPKTQCRQTYDYGKCVFKASHFEPPDDLFSFEGLRKKPIR
jgi:hypothetical protein